MSEVDVYHITATALFGDNYDGYIRENMDRELMGTVRPKPLPGFDRIFSQNEKAHIGEYFRTNAELYERTLDYVRRSADSTRTEWRQTILNAISNGNTSNNDGEPIRPPEPAACRVLLDKLLDMARAHRINK